MSSLESSQKRVALGLSGGVDSAVCAHLLKEQGYNITGVYIECWNEPGCRAEQDRADALKIALELDIPFQVLDYKKQYNEKVMGYFLQEYKAGRTPNPDILCNSVVKFGLFYDWAMQQENYDFIATGHYAQIVSQDDHLSLAAGFDSFKDQTYFLHQINQEQLPHIIFPVGHLTKKQVRKEAQKRNIPVADKKDSVGICFVGDINVRAFLKEKLGEKPGKVVDTKGNEIGTHNGLWFYTIGQRQGFSINTKLVQENTSLMADKHNPPPLYVIDKDSNTNQLIVGTKKDTATKTFSIAKPHSISQDSSWIENTSDLLVRIRHTGKLIPCTIIKTQDDASNNTTYTIALTKPVEGVAEGQSAVFYSISTKSNNTLCLGGGVITASHS